MDIYMADTTSIGTVPIEFVEQAEKCLVILAIEL